MASDRSNSRPLKPGLATSTRTAITRTPLTPRVAGSTTSTPPTSRPVPRAPPRTPLVSPRPRSQDTPVKDAVDVSNVTPRSSARRSRVGVGFDSPAQEDPPSGVRLQSGLVVGDGRSGRSSATSGLGPAPAPGLPPKTRSSRQNSVAGEGMIHTHRSPTVGRSPSFLDPSPAVTSDSIESRFFHASEAQKQEPPAKKPTLKKTPTFFYADGKEDSRESPLKPSSPVLSAVSATRPWTKPEPHLYPIKSPPMLSPAPNTSSTGLSYFPPTVPHSPQLRSPSPSKENIHLSYRKGVSQIFGMRPVPSSVSPVSDVKAASVEEEPRRPSLGQMHRKSTSLSSVSSALSQTGRRRSNTGLEDTASGSPLANEIKAAASSQLMSLNSEPSAIDTSTTSSAGVGSPPEASLSPTKSVSQLALDARRERKVLDLEISNSSLMAINTSLERELRRQKAELKRFRRLSRAGRFSAAPHDFPRRISDDLEPLDEDDEDAESLDFASGLGDDDASDSEVDSEMSGGPLSPGSQSTKERERLAKDEKRLQVDLQRHKELLTSSQAMNQSLKRCMYAAEDMIREGKKALEYHVRVSDVKLGGRVLSDLEDDETQEIEVEDMPEGQEHGVETAIDGSEGSGDRDSGIEVDKSVGIAPY